MSERCEWYRATKAESRRIDPANSTALRWKLRAATRCLRERGIVAYPSEAVYGLGCDPFDAECVYRLLALKRRCVRKGLIVIAASHAQLSPLLGALGAELRSRLDATWPGPTTWLLPCSAAAPFWVTGGRDLIAVRVTAHPIAAALCRSFGGPLISTSANVGGAPPAKSALQVRARLGDGVDLILAGRLGGRRLPTEIRDARDGRLVRAGSPGQGSGNGD